MVKSILYYECPTAVFCAVMIFNIISNQIWAAEKRLAIPIQPHWEFWHYAFIRRR